LLQRAFVERWGKGKDDAKKPFRRSGEGIWLHRFLKTCGTTRIAACSQGLA
jgi:hypothetical protein